MANQIFENGTSSNKLLKESVGQAFLPVPFEEGLPVINRLRNVNFVSPLF